LNISLPKADTLSNSPSVPAAIPQTQSDKLNDVKLNAQNPTTTTNIPNFIEFSLESKLDNTSSQAINTPLNAASQAPATGGKS
jgi:hypothetical protein